MSGIYTAVFNNVAVTAVQDLFEIVAASDAVVPVFGVGNSSANLATVGSWIVVASNSGDR